MKKKISRILAFVPPLLWAWVIWSFSDTPAADSTEESVSVTEMLLNLISWFVTIDPSKKAVIIMSMEPHIRKIAHMTEFGILFLLLMIPIRLFLEKLFARISLAVLIAFLYACSDEIHQLFVEGRAGRASDVLIDMLGVLAAVMIYLIFALLIRIMKAKPRSESRCTRKGLQI